MYDFKNILYKEPVVVAGAVRVVLHSLVLLGILALSAPQLAGISVAIEGILVLFTRSNVSPVERPTEGEAE